MLDWLGEELLAGMRNGQDLYVHDEVECTVGCHGRLKVHVEV